ncbi:hypothetical protein AVEN_241468-1, partial [Araneus ventricosus]
RKISLSIRSCSKVCSETRFKAEELLPPFSSYPTRSYPLLSAFTRLEANTSQFVILVRQKHPIPHSDLSHHFARLVDAFHQSVSRIEAMCLSKFPQLCVFTRGPNVGRSFALPLPSHRGLKLESADGVLDFEFVEIPPLSIMCSKFHRLSTLTIGLSFACSKNSKIEQR